MGKNRDFSKFPNAITVLDNGNVGIGVSTPDNLLVVSGAIGSSRIEATTTGRSALTIQNTGNNITMGIENATGNYFSAPAYSINFQGSGNYPMLFWTNSAERMRVTNGGIVAINFAGGTSGGVSHPLQVKGLTSNNQGIWVEAGSTSDAGIEVTHNGTVGIIGTSYRTTSGYTPITFYTSGNERMRINSGGSINFGPQTDYTEVGNDSGGTYIEKMASPTEGKRKIRMQAGNSASTQYTQFIIDGSNQTMEFRTNSTNRFFINSGGQINTPYQPAFFAVGLPADLNATYGGGPITFSNAPTNRGSHWNGSRFTAPVSGIYYMAFESMYHHQGGDISFRVLKNGASVSYSNPHTLDNGGYYPPWSQSTTTWVGTLAAGDYIEFSFVSSNYGSTFIYAGGLYTKVYGYMIG